MKSGKVNGPRFDALEKVCQVLDCQPADLLEFMPDARPRALAPWIIRRLVTDLRAGYSGA
ncbi:helix-turn-helix domain-containing protein [uncultured Planktomarina sp.]|uniref:helix-turn-helix domain-containing protein n=1 Tax=uncultured Planktomarina sp. TaxID=1538529 RepID=UPI00326031E9